MNVTHNTSNSPPVRVSIENIIHYPFHWHECIEIIIVLEGRIHLLRRIENKVMEPGEMEIINVNEVHEIKKITEENSVLILQIDLSVAETFVGNFKYYFFNSQLFPKFGAKDKEVSSLKQKIYRLALQLYNEDNYIDVEMSTKEIVTYITKNFDKIHQYFSDDVNAEFNIPRFFRIREYILSGFKDKIGLKQLAKQEHLSLCHLSHEFNKRFGYSFSYGVNMCRVEHSVRLLLGTDMNIFEITLECGFSAVRYYNKHFKSFYKISPSDFRKEYKESHKNFFMLEKCKALNSSYVVSLLRQESIEIENNKNSLVQYNQLHIDAKEVGNTLKHEWKGALSISNYEPPSLDRFFDNLRQIQTEIGFEQMNMNRLFDHIILDTDIENNSTDWQEIENLFEFLHKIKLKPVIILNKKEFITHRLHLKLLLEHLNEIWNYSFLKNIFVSVDGKQTRLHELCFDSAVCELNNSDIEDDIHIESKNLSNDGIVFANKIISDFITKRNNIELIELVDNDGEDFFVGEKGLFTSNGLMKASYYSYYFLGLLGDEIIKISDSHIVTKKGESIQILLYNNNCNISKENIPDHETYKQYLANNKKNYKKINSSVTNLDGDYKVTRYELNRDNGSVYDRWLTMWQISNLNKTDIKLLNNICFPMAEMEFFNGKTFDFQSEIPIFGVELITIEKINN